MTDFKCKQDVGEWLNKAYAVIIQINLQVTNKSSLLDKLATEIVPSNRSPKRSSFKALPFLLPE